MGINSIPISGVEPDVIDDEQKRSLTVNKRAFRKTPSNIYMGRCNSNECWMTYKKLINTFSERCCTHKNHTDNIFCNTSGHNFTFCCSKDNVAVNPSAPW